MNCLSAVLVLLMAHDSFILANPTPMKLPGFTNKLTPFIRHWEAANYDRGALHEAHLKHIEQARSRKKRALDRHELGLANTIRLNFTAHDKDFRLILHQNPMSVFAKDVEIENTIGPVQYDLSRVYTGTLEGDDSAHVHAVLTSDNLLDGTIETSAEHYYLEPSSRYSQKLYESGVHSILYKVSDVNMSKTKISSTANVPSYCASESLRRKRRWLQDDLPVSTNAEYGRNPPLPLDLEVPYNDDFRVLATNEEFSNKHNRNAVKQNENFEKTKIPDSIPVRTPPPTKQQNFMPPTSHNVGDSRSYNSNSNSNSYNNNNLRKLYTKHKNIIVSTYNRPGNDQEYQPFDDKSSSNVSLIQNVPNNFFNSNWTTLFMENENDRPSHKTHVEIITKNGATKKPNIIINNYNPEISLAPNPHNPNFNSMFMMNLLSEPGGHQDINHLPRLLYDRKTTCMLYLQADHTFFQKMGSDEASIEAITRHVQRANSIYKNTDFNNDGKPDNITFMIKRIKIHNMNAINDPSYRFPGNYGVEKFLELFSEEDYDAFCLAYMFTYRDFEMGTLGLAWTGDLKNAGGVCEKNGHYRGSLKSLNTGIVTLLNYGKHVPPAVSHVTLAHEIGHNFGSPHDPEQCTPGGEDGNFIMFARATSGDKKNNNKFSTCSLKSIEPVLNAKARSVKGCFTEPQTSICGNGVVEPGEQCDCGWEEDCMDSCCFPMSRQPRIDENPCTLTSNARCSPSQGPCCTADCKLKFGDKCRDDNGCRDPSFCDGREPQCPPSVNKPNKTICNKEFVCYMGDCTGSICLAYGLESCQCIPGPNDDRIKSCELCCKLPGEGNPCLSSFEWNEPPFDVPDMYSKPGTPCNDYNGYCDVFQKCREVDPSGPLATLRKLLLSEESIATFKKWMQHNWYTVVLALVGVFVLLILSTKLLAKRSKLKQKTVTIIHSSTTETVRLPDNNSGVIVHTAVRTKVPFKQKVRGERSKTKKSTETILAGTKSVKPIANTSIAPSVGTNNFIKTNSVKKKPIRIKKKPIMHVNPLSENEESSANDAKMAKKLGKQIIDYSQHNIDDESRMGMAAGNHTNTFGKVQKWLLESPIVVQPLSHFEHTSKVRKVISKSQSTPERLVQKMPKKTKSMGNLSNDKVKLQVVYKPPFKFSLRLSKKSKMKTHILVGSHNKRPTKSFTRNSGSHHQLSKEIKSLYTDKTKRSALLLYTDNDEDNQVLTLNEPNYESLKKKTNETGKLHANVDKLAASSKIPEANDKNNHNKTSSETKITPSVSKTNQDAKLSSKSVVPSMKINQSQLNRPTSYHRSISLSSSNPFTVAMQQNSVQLKPEGTSSNLNRNFGSTQNLINLSQTNLNKTKKRSSLNLKTNAAKNGKESSHRRSSSNINLTRDSSGTNLPFTQHQLTNTLAADSTTTAPQNTLLQRQTSYDTNPISANGTPTPSQSSQRSSRCSINNIPRVSLSNANLSCTRQSSITTTASTSAASNQNQNHNHGHGLQQSASALASAPIAFGPLRRAQPLRRSNNFQNRSVNNCTASPAVDNNELPSDLEVVVSDIENLVN